LDNNFGEKKIMIALNQNLTKMAASDLRAENRASDYTGFASGGVTCKLDALCFYSSSMLVGSFVIQKPPELIARKY
jgi:hypothetical protein